MPYVKSIRIYNEQGIDACQAYVEDTSKTSISETIGNTARTSYLSNAIGYAANAEKTSIENNSFVSDLLDDDVDILVSGYRCNAATVERDFQMVRDDYYRHKNENLSGNKKARSAYHFIQSFDPRFEIDPRLVHQIGLELLNRLEHFQGTVNTHMNTKHVHNHIIMNAFSCDDYVKWKDDMEHIHMVRNISDELSLKYGVPIILNPVKGKGMSYTEWMNVQKGTSWKQQIRNDISTTMQVCSSWEEYVQIMRAAGYGIRETANSVAYILPSDENKRVRDIKLGPEFTKAALQEYWKNNLEQAAHKTNIVNPATQVSVNKKKKIDIYVSRYTASGRKRTDLEIMILIAIKIIRVVGDRFRSEEVAKLQPANPINKLASWKLTQMMDSLHLLQSLDIQSREELQELLNKTGAELSHLKKEVAELEGHLGKAEQVLQTILEVEELKTIMQSIGFEEKDLVLPDFSEKEIRINRAAISPLTAKQRRELFVALSDSEYYRLSCDFNELTHEDGTAILNFIKGRNANKPDMVVSIDEYNEHRLKMKFEKIREKKSNNLKKKYGDMPLTDAQRRIIGTLVQDKSLKLDLDSLSFYDGLMLISYLKAESPFDSELITEEQALNLERVLEKNKFIINRNIRTVTLKEYDTVIGYFAGKNNTLPDLLKPSEKVSKSVISQLKELLEFRGERLPFDIEELSQIDANKLYSYLLYLDEIPDCITDARTDPNTRENYDLLFNSNLLDWPEEYCDLISRYRTAASTLKGVGIDLDSLEKAKKEIQGLKEELAQARMSREVLGKNYYNYSRLNYNLGLAENHAFTHGALYKDVLQEIDVTEISELTDVSDAVLEEEEDIDRATNDGVYQKEDEFFNNIDDFEF